MSLEPVQIEQQLGYGNMEQGAVRSSLRPEALTKVWQQPLLAAIQPGQGAQYSQDRKKTGVQEAYYYYATETVPRVER